MTRMGFIGNEADSVTLPSDMIGPGMSDQHVSNRILEVLIRNPAEAARIRDAMESAGVRSISQPFYEVADGDAAHAAARADGLRRARANAEAYAAAANMRVVRMLRISDRTTAESLQWTMIMAMSGGRRPAGSGTDVETQEHVSVDFALAPR